MRPCIEPDCNSLARTGARCPTHAQAHVAAKSRRRNQAAPPHGAAATMRATIKTTGWGYCSAPDHPGPGLLPAADIEVDHVVPLADGGGDTHNNVQTLCRPCHKTKSDAEPRARYRNQP